MAFGNKSLLYEVLKSIRCGEQGWIPSPTYFHCLKVNKNKILFCRSMPPKKFKIRDASSALTFFLSAGNHPGVFKNSTEHTELLFITFKQFPQTSFLTAAHQYGI